MLVPISLLACIALTQTTEVGEGLSPGAPVPDFTILDMNGRPTSYSTLRGQVVVVTFISTRCPISNAFNKRMNDLYLAFGNRVRFLFVNANANESMDEVRAHSKTVEYDFPVYKDKEGAVAELLGASATPDAFVIDRGGILRYHGYI